MSAATPAPGTISPATGEALDAVASAAPADVTQAITTARAAQVAWADAGFEARAVKVKALAQAILADAETGVQIMSSETGRSPTECRLSEIATIAEYTADAVSTGRSALAPEKASLSMIDFPKKQGVVEMVPRGVVAIIAPWNYPLMQIVKPLIPALLAGNGVIIKPSEHTPRTGAWLGQLCDQVFPQGLVQVLQGGGDIGGALVNGPVDAITFTGSVRTGKKVAVACAERLLPYSVELGGKDAAIVLADCNLDRTVAGLAWGAFHNAGQDCAGIERIYVEEAIADKLVSQLSAVANKLQVAPDGRCDLGPLCNAQQLAIVEAHVAQAREAGATVAAGGERTGTGYGYRPTVLDHCTQDMTAVREETFGPVVAVVRVKDAGEALRLANDSQYGLNGSVWTGNLERGKQLARQLEVGIAHVNSHKWTGGTLAHTPWTGVKDTGPGVIGSKHTYHTFARPMLRMWDWNAAPEPFWFPADDNLDAFSQALVRRGKGQFTAIFSLLGLLGKRVKAASGFVKEG